MQCDMCGTDTRLVLASVEGTEMKVCGACAKFGKILKPVYAPPTPKTLIRQQRAIREQELEETVEVMVENYSALIKQAREKANLKQEELALKINEKLSLIHQIETGHMELSIPLAKKLEHFFGITLIEEVKSRTSIASVHGDNQITIGDMITIKKRPK